MASRKDFIIVRPTTETTVTFTRLLRQSTHDIRRFVVIHTVAPVNLSATSTHALPRLTIRQPQSELAAGTSTIHSAAFFLSLHFCGIWWSLRIMFPTLGLFFIEYNLHLRKKERKTWRLRSALESCFFFAIRFCAYKRWPQAYINCSFLFTKLQSMQFAIAVIWHCRRRCFSPSTARD